MFGYEVFRTYKIFILYATNELKCFPYIILSMRRVENNATVTKISPPPQGRRTKKIQFDRILGQHTNKSGSNIMKKS